MNSVPSTKASKSNLLKKKKWKEDTYGFVVGLGWDFGGEFLSIELRWVFGILGFFFFFFFLEKKKKKKRDFGGGILRVPFF